VIIISSLPESPYATLARRAGAHGFVTKSALVQELGQAVRTVLGDCTAGVAAITRLGRRRRFGGGVWKARGARGSGVRLAHASELAGGRRTKANATASAARPAPRRQHQIHAEAPRRSQRGGVKKPKIPPDTNPAAWAMLLAWTRTPKIMV